MISDGRHAVTELTIGEHDIRTDASILTEAMGDCSARQGHTGRYAMVEPGTDLLRDTVGPRMPGFQDHAPECPPRATTCNLITPGGQSALFAAHVAVCDPGDVGLYLDPYYATYPGTIRGAGAVARSIQTTAEDAFQPRAEQIEAAADGAVSLLVNTPNNPTGVVYSRQTLEGIAEVCRKRDLWLISDEVYDTQVWEGNTSRPEPCRIWLNALWLSGRCRNPTR